MDDLALRNRIRSLSPKKPHAPRSRLGAVRCALRGLADVWRSDAHLRLHLAAAVMVTAVGLWVGLSRLEWLWVAFAIGLVVFTELMNTAIEQAVDFVVGGRFDPMARQVKDVAAGCVLIAAMIAVVIGTATFGPHVLAP